MPGLKGLGFEVYGFRVAGFGVEGVEGSGLKGQGLSLRFFLCISESWNMDLGLVLASPVPDLNGLSACLL